MFPPDLLRDLYRHMEWADARMWAAVPFGGPVDPRLRELILHIHVVQRAFFYIWTRGPVVEAFRKPDDFVTLADMRAWATTYYGAVMTFLDSVTEEQLAEQVKMPWADQMSAQLGRPGVTTLGETCFQVTWHSTHHRGQITARLRELGANPPLVDYIAWLWLGRPAADWA